MLEPHPRAHPVRYQAIEAELGAALSVSPGIAPPASTRNRGSN
ncbi:hypothetical protein [Zestomonas thermotolerans]|nr:hypothetical protein [Pseudomonas thermotolerans]